jgi:hypothetical protein
MSRCVGCGNVEGQLFTVTLYDTVELTFDSVQCALPFIAPVCAECFCQILGRGIALDDEIYCSASCARIGSQRDQRSHIRGLA